MDSKQEIFANSFYYAKNTTSNVSVAMLLFKLSNLASAKHLALVGMTIPATAFSTAIETHLSLMDVSTAV